VYYSGKNLFMKKILHYILVIGMILSSSCSSVYIPNVPNTPMLSSQGEFKASGHVTLRGNVSVNTAYAVSDNIGVLVNGSHMDNDRSKKEFSQNLVEAGAGYYTTFGPKNKRILEIYGGYGQGSSDRTYKDRNQDGVLIYSVASTEYNKYFTQVNYSSKNNKSLKLFGKAYDLNYGTIFRLSYINMSSFTIDGAPHVKEDNIFIEPVFFTRMALSKTLQLQYTNGSNFGLKNRKYLTAGNSVFTLGLVLGLGGKR